MFAPPSARRARVSSPIGIALLLSAVACDGEETDGWIGVCEQLYTSFDVIDGDRRASIAAVETTGPCMVSPGSCAAHMSTDAGAATACERVTLYAHSAGSCTLTVTSVSGQKVSAQIDLHLEPGDQKCRDGVGRIVPDVPFLRPDRPAVTIRFPVPDAGAGGQ
jgi:hypothetical protein